MYNMIWHDLSVTVDIMRLQFGHDVLQHDLSPGLSLVGQVLSNNLCLSTKSLIHGVSFEALKDLLGQRKFLLFLAPLSSTI